MQTFIKLSVGFVNVLIQKDRVVCNLQTLFGAVRASEPISPLPHALKLTLCNKYAYQHVCSRFPNLKTSHNVAIK